MKEHSPVMIQEANIINFTTGKGPKNSAWEHFWFNCNFTEKDKKKRTVVFCKLCPKRINYQENTTNMIVHLATVQSKSQIFESESQG